MKNYEQIGKRWIKGNMDRVYIDIDGTVEYDEIPVKNYFNRYQWGNLKVYFDNKSGELVITAGNEKAKEAVKAIIDNMLKED